jgi:hypothetical protein
MEMALDHAAHRGRVHPIENNSLSHSILFVWVILLFAVAIRTINRGAFSARQK